MVLEIFIAICGLGMFLYSWFLAKSDEDLIWAKLCYFFGLLSAIEIIAVTSWNFSSKSIMNFYLCILFAVIVYICIYIYTVNFFRTIIENTNKIGYLLIVRCIIVSISLLLIIWFLVIFGMFIHDNSIIPLENMYKYINEYSIWYEYFTGLFKITVSFFSIGMTQLFDATPNGDWMIFIQSFKGIYGSVVVGSICGIILNALGIGNINLERKDFEKNNKT